jgi:hypothetical protein
MYQFFHLGFVAAEKFNWGKEHSWAVSMQHGKYMKITLHDLDANIITFVASNPLITYTIYRAKCTCTQTLLETIYRSKYT